MPENTSLKERSKKVIESDSPMLEDLVRKLSSYFQSPAILTGGAGQMFYGNRTHPTQDVDIVICVPKEWAEDQPTHTQYLGQTVFPNLGIEGFNISISIQSETDDIIQFEFRQLCIQLICPKIGSTKLDKVISKFEAFPLGCQQIGKIFYPTGESQVVSTERYLEWLREGTLTTQDNSVYTYGRNLDAMMEKYRRYYPGQDIFAPVIWPRIR